MTAQRQWLASQQEAEALAQRIMQEDHFWRAWPCERRDDQDGTVLGYGVTIEYATQERWVVDSFIGFEARREWARQ